jgi:leucyl aminopeptidase
MWKCVDLVSEINGYTPAKFARNLAHHIYPDHQIDNFVITEDKISKQSMKAFRSAMPANLI